SGALFENSVFLNLKKYGKLNYYEKRSRGKIDFILNNKIAFEIKTKGADFDIKKLKKIAGSIGIKQCYLLTKEFDKKDNFIPAVEV
ncbi:DUF4143 domain-containing protein, partial [Patescibacteria group bacterium]|nr:DUF4143 domain-containing protein [Patescibacteria group bacterium]